MLEVLRRLLKSFQRDPRGHHVRGDAYVRVESRDQFLITLGDRGALVYAELMAGKPDRIVDRSSIKKWVPPNEHQPLTEADREQILEILMLRFDDLKQTYEVQ